MIKFSDDILFRDSVYYVGTFTSYQFDDGSSFTYRYDFINPTSTVLPPGEHIIVDAFSGYKKFLNKSIQVEVKVAKNPSDTTRSVTITTY